MGCDRWWVDLAVFMFALDGCIWVADMLSWVYALDSFCSIER